jgi:DNA-binding transcriptional LysR family regulator
VELRQLRHFLALVEHGNYARAAERMHITPQALNASISKLEESVGVPLFEGGRVGLVPTQFAAALIPHAQLACAEVARAKDTLSRLATADVGTVAIGVGWFSSLVLVTKAIGSLLATHPTLDITLIEGPSEDLHTRLLRGELDLVVSTPSEDVEIASDLVTETLWESTDCVFVNREHPLAGREQVGLAEAVTFPWVASAGTESRTPRLLEACDAHAIPRPAQVIRGTSAYAVEQMLMTRNALMLGGTLPAPFRLPFLERCATFEVPELRRRFRALMAWRRSPPPLPAAMRIVDAIRTAFSKSRPVPVTDHVRPGVTAKRRL